MSELVTREEWRLVRIRRSGCREERRVYGRAPSPERALELFREYAPYGSRHVEWSIEHYTVTEEWRSTRCMTVTEVAEATEAEATKAVNRW